MDTLHRPHSAAGRAILAALAACATLTACGGSGGGESPTPVTKAAPLSSTAGSGPGSTATARASRAAPTANASATASATTEGRLLASNCFQCHGTNGTGGFDSIRGGEAKEIQEFLTKAASKDIMAAHAQGYTPAQIQKVIAYLQQ